MVVLTFDAFVFCSKCLTHGSEEWHQTKYNDECWWWWKLFQSSLFIYFILCSSFLHPLLSQVKVCYHNVCLPLNSWYKFLFCICNHHCAIWDYATITWKLLQQGKTQRVSCVHIATQSTHLRLLTSSLNLSN